VLDCDAFMYLISVLEFNTAFSDVANRIENKRGKRPWFYHTYAFCPIKGQFKNQVDDFNSFLNRIGFRFNILISYASKTFVRATLERIRLARSLRVEFQNHGDARSESMLGKSLTKDEDTTIISTMGQ
jgi:hypothetical protein